MNKLRAERDPSLGIMLLADCRRVMAWSQTGSPLSTCSRSSTLLEESPWGDLRGQPLDSRGAGPIACAPTDVRPAKHRFGEMTAKGYLRTDFYDAWTRYLPLPPPEQGEQAEQGERELGRATG